MDAERRCKHCRWFGTSSNCGTDPDTLACATFENPPVSWEDIRRDPVLAGLLHNVKNEPKYQIDPSLEQELLRYQVASEPITFKSRIPRGSSRADFAVLAQLHAENQAARDRIAYVCATLYRTKRELLDLWDYVYAYLYHRWPEKMATLKNEALRNNTINWIIIPEIKWCISKIMGVLDIAQTIQSNLDNVHFTLKEVNLNIQNLMWGAQDVTSR